MRRPSYPPDLTDSQWEPIRPYLETDPNKADRPRTYLLREIVNACLYVLRAGNDWRAIPHDLPPWSDVYDHFRRWRRNGTLERLHDALREQVRQAEGKETSPSWSGSAPSWCCRNNGSWSARSVG